MGGERVKLHSKTNLTTFSIVFLIVILIYEVYSGGFSQNALLGRVENKEGYSISCKGSSEEVIMLLQPVWHKRENKELININLPVYRDENTVIFLKSLYNYDASTVSAEFEIVPVYASKEGCYLSLCTDSPQQSCENKRKARFIDKDGEELNNLGSYQGDCNASSFFVNFDRKTLYHISTPITMIISPLNKMEYK